MNTTAGTGYTTLSDEDYEHELQRTKESTQLRVHRIRVRHEETQAENTPRLVRTKIRATGSHNHVADFIYADGSVRSFDGKAWTVSSLLNRELMGV